MYNPKYNHETSRIVSVRLNKAKDKDLIDALEGKEASPEIMRLCRVALKKESEDKDNAGSDQKRSDMVV